jgi:hypothetical protein
MPSVNTAKMVAAIGGVHNGELDAHELFNSLQGLNLRDTADLPKVRSDCCSDMSWWLI